MTDFDAQVQQMVSRVTSPRETLTDTGNAYRFARLFQGLVRYLPTERTWLVWDGHRLRRDTSNLALDMTLGVIADLRQRAEAISDATERRAMEKWATHSESISGRRSMLEAACPLRELVARVRDATVKTLTVCAVRLDVHLADEHACVRADADGLQRVLINLIVNAAEASPVGRTVYLQAAAPQGGEVQLQVLDEGLGLPEEIRHRIFDPFFTTKQHGTGLGLTIAHRLIEAYGGRLTADNRPEGGAVFTVVLREAQPAAAPETERHFSAA